VSLIPYVPTRYAAIYAAFGTPSADWFDDRDAALYWLWLIQRRRRGIARALWDGTTLWAVMAMDPTPCAREALSGDAGKPESFPLPRPTLLFTSYFYDHSEGREVYTMPVPFDQRGEYSIYRLDYGDWSRYRERVAEREQQRAAALPRFRRAPAQLELPL
jgi:hypothetical protein